MPTIFFKLFILFYFCFDTNDQIRAHYLNTCLRNPNIPSIWVSQRLDKASTLGDAIVYLRDLEEQVMELEASKNEVQSRFESLQVSYKALEESKDKMQQQCESLQVSYNDLKISRKPSIQFLDDVSPMKETVLRLGPPGPIRM